MLNSHLVKSWFRYMLTARNRHGLHSPFIYKLADQVIYDRKASPDYEIVEKQRGRLLNDERSIRITDLGAGSQYGNRKEKKVAALARTALKSPRLAQLIYRLARYVCQNAPPDHRPTVLELGTCLGITTAYLARACPSARVITIEGCPETATLARQLFAGAPETARIESLTGNFDTVLPSLLTELPSLDLLFVDGNHREAATLNYFEACLPALHEHSMIIFDDIHWSSGMESAWERIKAHPAVTVSIDLFHIGLVFFRKGQAKEHFVLRF